MPLRIWNSLNAFRKEAVDIQEEEEEGGEYLFDPEAGRASDNPFAHLELEESPSEEAVSEMSVSKYDKGEEE
jgi:uncharacterized protein (DUF2384 family)|tara:strand:+ start:1020 stop:1235 length:216 start_codon:yes stop_codon:yes gene_type:complete